MQMVKPKRVAKFTKIKSMYIVIDSEFNQISNKGYKWLSKAHWNLLTELYLSIFRISEVLFKSVGLTTNI
jgi:hypothetical protein